MVPFYLLPRESRDEMIEKCPLDFGRILGRHSHNARKNIFSELQEIDKNTVYQGYDQNAFGMA